MTETNVENNIPFFLGNAWDLFRLILLNTFDFCVFFFKDKKNTIWLLFWELRYSVQVHPGYDDKLNPHPE